MAGNTIEARLRIAADLAQAIAQLRSLRRELLDTGEAARRAGGTQGGAAAGGGVVPGTGAAAAKEAKDTLAATRERMRVEREARQASAREERDARLAANRARYEESQRAAADLANRRAVERKANSERVREEQEAARRVRAATNLQAQAYRQLPAQITDITTSLASGMPVWLVAIQQGGQIRDSFGGIGSAVRGVLSLLTPARVAFGLLAGAIGLVAFQALQGWRESDRLGKSIALTGNSAGQTLGQLDGLARQIAASTRTSVLSVRQTLQALIDTGGQSSQTLEASARAVTAYRRLTGASAEEAVRIFDGQAESVLAWATKANRAYNFLNAAQVAQIRELQAQGRNAEAARLANEQLAATLEQRSVPAIGAVERAWKRVGEVVGAVIDRIRGLGRERTLDERIAELQAKLAQLRDIQASARSDNRPRYDPEIARVQAEVAELERMRGLMQDAEAEREALRIAENERIRRESKQFQDAIANVEEAGVQKRLAQRLAALDREQQAVELARAQELVGAEETALRLAGIEERRLQAQADAVRRQIEIERGRVVEKPEDTLAKQQAILRLESQLLELQSRLATAAGQAQLILANDARAQAEAWEKAWREAYEKVRDLARRNASDAAARTLDPAERARLEAEAQTRQEREELAAQRRRLRLRIDLTLDPQQVAELQRQLDALDAEGGAQLAERVRKARFDSLQKQFAEQTESLSIAEQALDAQVENGALLTEEAEERKIQARARSIPQLRTIADLLKKLAQTPDEFNQVRRNEQKLSDLEKFIKKFEAAAKSSATSEITKALDDIITGAKSAGEALRDMALGFARTMLNVLNQRLAERLVDQFTKSLQSANAGNTGGGNGSWWAALANWLATVFHSGGVVGAGGGTVRAVSPLAFAGAQVLHGGGMVAGLAGGLPLGLKSNERAAILEVGEEVLRRDDPRHISNGGGAGVTINASFTFNGASGTEQDQRAAARELNQAVEGAVERWAARQQRQGGILSGGRRG